VTDVETLQTIAELCVQTPADADAIGFDAIAEVQPGGHFFAAQHTMARYRTAFYAPLVADWSNYGAWSDAGAKTATQRARDVWKRRIAAFEAPAGAAATADALDAFIGARKESGGAMPES
jgi:trimethylamine---corrinoid protein Co-methyltransferase